MVLGRVDRPAAHAEGLDRAVVEVALADVEAAGLRQRVTHDLDLVLDLIGSEVESIDAFDGTPVLDLKPHIPESDGNHRALVPRWVRDE